MSEPEQNAVVVRIADDKRRFLEEFAKVGTIAATCRATGIGRATVYEWKKADKGFSADLEAARQAMGEEVVSSLYRQAMEGNTVAGIFLAKAADPARYDDRYRAAKLEAAATPEAGEDYAYPAFAWLSDRIKRVGYSGLSPEERQAWAEVCEIVDRSIAERDRKYGVMEPEVYDESAPAPVYAEQTERRLRSLRPIQEGSEDERDG